MIQKRQSFRLRIPWLFAPSRRVSKTEDESKFPTHSDTNVPIQRPASPPKQPSVIIESSVPSQPTTPTPFHSPLPSLQPSSRVSSPSPVSIASSSPKTPPHSPFHLASDGIIEVTKPTPEESLWPALSAFEQEKEKKVVSEEPIPQEAKPKVSSPLKAITKSPETAFQPEKNEKQPQDTQQKAFSVSSMPVSKTEPAFDQPPPPPSSPLASEHTGEVLKRDVDESTFPASLASQEEKGTMVEPVSKLVPQETEPKVKSPVKTISESPETSLQHKRIATQPQDSEQEASSVSSSLVSKTESASDQSPPSSPLTSEHTEESTLPPSPATQEEKEKMIATVSKPVLQEAESKIKSPLKTIPKSRETSFQHERMAAQPQDSEQQASSLPKFTVSKTKPTSDQPLHPSSPTASECIDEVLKPAKESSLPASSNSQKEKEKMAMVVSEPVPQEVEPKMKSPLKTIPKSPEISSKPEILYTKPTPIIRDVERSPTTETKKSDFNSTTRSSKAPLETQSKLLESREKKKEVHEPIKTRKAKDISTSQPSQHTMASGSGTKAKDPLSRPPFRADKNQHGAHETVARRLMFATSPKLGDKGNRFGSLADQRTRNVSSISPEKASLQKGIKDDVSKFVHKLATVDPTGIKGDISKLVHKLAIVNPKQPGDDKQFSVITLAGDNKGATMQLDSEATKKEESIHMQQDYKVDPEESTEVTTDVEENSKNDEVGKAYVNSNIQSINNSLMVHGSITESEPGVQVTLPQNP